MKVLSIFILNFNMAYLLESISEKKISAMLNREAIVETQNITGKFISNLFLVSTRVRRNLSVKKIEISERVYTVSSFEDRRIALPKECFDESRLHVQAVAEVCMLHKICLISLSRQTISVPLPLFWSRHWSQEILSS